MAQAPAVCPNNEKICGKLLYLSVFSLSSQHKMLCRMNFTLNCQGRLLSLSTPRVMGILNATPDSFYAGSRVFTESDLRSRVAQLRSEGATFVDVGACSTRPGGVLATEAEEMERLRWALPIVVSEWPEAIVSVDTFRADVARMSVEEYGVGMVNDVSGGQMDAAMFGMMARLRVPYVLTHSPRLPLPPTAESGDDDVVLSVMLFFASRLSELRSMGVADVIVDPGFGFGKNLRQNYELMHHLDYMGETGCPVLVGVSRKSMLTKLLKIKPDEALPATTALHVMALERGASILRVHDAGAAREAIALWQAVNHPQDIE